MLSGHTDVVPALESDWESDPFTLVDRGDRWVGRGSADMKGFLALATDLACRADLDRLTAPLVLLFTHDEEVGTLGAQRLARDWAGGGWRPLGVVGLYTVELPDRDPGLEARAGPHLRQHARPQARVRGSADGSPRRGVLCGGRVAAGRPERPHGRRLQGRCGDRLEPGRARHLVHGSVPVGRSVRDEATARDCRVQLELGGHNPLIVTAAAELDRAVEASYAGAFWSAGQKCTATRRILVEDTVYDAFREKLLARVAAGKVGDPADPDVEVGPVVNEGAMEDILGAIERARGEGGTLLAGGERADDDGYLIAPTIFEALALMPSSRARRCSAP